jgi:acyl-CoA reductase-like NAD-dependent aldehyde dehydrogenase
MRYRDQIKEARKWSYVEAGFSEELPPDERQAALERANALYEEAVNELEELEAEEDESYNKYERKYIKTKKRWDNAA